MLSFRAIAQATVILLVASSARMLESQEALDTSKECTPRKPPRQLASQEVHTDMFGALVPAGDSAAASAVYLATLLQEIQTALVAPDTVGKLSDGVMGLWLHADGRLTNPRPLDTLLPREVAAALTAAIDTLTARDWLGPVMPPLRTDSVELRLVVHYPDQRTPLSVPLFRVASLPAYFEFQVEKPAMAAPGNPSPRYPQALREFSIEGDVLAQFVVSRTGSAEMRTLRFLEATHAEFAAAVRAVLPRMRFYPAEIAGCPVRQLVQVPFAFRIGF